MNGSDRPDLLENLRRRERGHAGPRGQGGQPAGQPGPARPRVDEPTTPTVPIAQLSEARTVAAAVPVPLPEASGHDRPGAAAEAAAASRRRSRPRSGPGPGPSPRPGSSPRSGPRAAPAAAARARRLPALALVAALAAVDCWGFARLFAPAEPWPAMLLAAVAPVVLVAALAGRAGRPAPFALSALLWTAGFVAAAAATVAGGAGGAGARLAAVRAGVVEGPTRLLDVAVPAPAEPDLLVVPFAVTWLAAAVGAELVVRTRTRLLPALPALAGLVVATAAAVPAAGSNLAPAVVLTALTGLLTLARRPPAVVAPRPAPPAASVGADGSEAPKAAEAAGSARTGPPPARITLGPDRPSRVPGAARAATALAVVVVAAALAGDRLPAALGGGGPVDPRAYRSVPAGQVDGLNPLSALAGWNAHPDDPLFTLELTGGQAAGPVPLRLAALTDFDGVTWASSARYTRAGLSLPRGGEQPAADEGARVTQRLTIAGLTGQLLPALDRPVELGEGEERSVAGGFAVDAGAGLLLRTAPLAAGDQFTIVSAPAPARPVTELAALTSGSAAAADLALPAGVPPVLRALAHTAADQGTGPFQRAALLQRYLASNFQFDPRLAPGHSLAHIEHFVADTRRGTSEQFATTFVLAARVLGLPSRVVVGFAPEQPAGSASVTVTGRAALAWAEVWFDGAGWLPFFPTPPAADAGGAALAGGAQGEPAAQTALVDAAVRGPLTAPVTAPIPAVAGAARPGRAPARPARRPPRPAQAGCRPPRRGP
ncbi:transglutaminase domain-containing protein, partial [Frankia nepalensis]|uniref:transglutaminase domain-containing protein n=1 Tax=Frankia nepalensis TaxID=1836974 RepID=UPI00193478E6